MQFSEGGPTKRTTAPMVTGGSVVALKYAGGVLVATDTLASYGSMARFEGVTRMSPVGMANDTLLAAGGDYSDYQQMLKMIDAKATTEYTMDDGASMSPSMLHHWLTRIIYQRRSKMDPLWNSIVIAGFRGGKSYLGTTDGAWYAKFLKELVGKWQVRDQLDGTETLGLMDNAGYHRTPDCQEVAEAGECRILLNQPYSPEFNKAELYIRAHKALIGEKLRQGR